MTCFIENLTLLQWSGTEPTVPARYAYAVNLFLISLWASTETGNICSTIYWMLSHWQTIWHVLCRETVNLAFFERLTNASSSIRVLQRNRTNWIETKRDLLWGIGSCDENSKSQDLQGELANWTPRGAGGLVPVQVWRSKKQRTNALVPEPPGRKNSLLYREKSAFLFYSGLQLIRWGPLTWWRAIFFTQSTDLNVNLTPKHPHSNTQYNVWPSNLGTCGPVMLVHKVAILAK